MDNDGKPDLRLLRGWKEEDDTDVVVVAADNANNTGRDDDGGTPMPAVGTTVHGTEEDTLVLHPCPLLQPMAVIAEEEAAAYCRPSPPTVLMRLEHPHLPLVRESRMRTTMMMLMSGGNQRRHRYC